MKVSFRTKEESNKEQEREFLSLSPVERIYAFLELMMGQNNLHNSKTPKNNNFLVEIVTGSH